MNVLRPRLLNPAGQGGKGQMSERPDEFTQSSCQQANVPQQEYQLSGRLLETPQGPLGHIQVPLKFIQGPTRYIQGPLGHIQGLPPE